MSRKLYGLRKTKIHQIILFTKKYDKNNNNNNDKTFRNILYNELYILIMKDMNNKEVSTKNIFNWEKYISHKSKYVLLDSVIKSIYNQFKC